MHPLRRAVCLLLALALIAAPVSATWSIILIDTRTGEIAIGSATCLTSFDLRRTTPVLIVNVGAATAQASVPGTIANRALIWNLMQAGAPPGEILAALAATDPGHQSRQYGIVDVQGRKATFSGAFTQQWAGGVTGSVGTIHYAIQGNILTGAPVVTAAEQAVLNTSGDLAEKLMAAMEAAREFGGDGRCSCTTGPATSCGSPPPSFTKSAHIGYMIVARQGDDDGTCSSTALGCASGSYWMNHNVAFQTASAPDPVLQLRALFDAWRLTLAGRPDHHRSTVALDPPTLIPDGSAKTTATVALRDWQGNPLGVGGATVTVTAEPTGTAPVTLGPVTDHGNGTYSFEVTAGTIAGTAELRISVDDGVSEVLLSPRTPVVVRADPLWANRATLTAAAGGAALFRLDAGAGAAGRVYAVAMSASGTTPGIPIPPATLIPLNPDPFFAFSLALANSRMFVNTLGLLDATGRAPAAFAAPGGGFLAPLIGADLDFAFVLLGPLDFASNPVRVTVAP